MNEKNKLINDLKKEYLNKIIVIAAPKNIFYDLRYDSVFNDDDICKNSDLKGNYFLCTNIFEWTENLHKKYFRDSYKSKKNIPVVFKIFCFEFIDLKKNKKVYVDFDYINKKRSNAFRKTFKVK